MCIRDRAKTNNEELSLLIMDLDNFKNINDSFGHAAGDEMIREIGSIILTSFRKTDIVGRIGGEEFAVVLRLSLIHIWCRYEHIKNVA